MTILAIGSQIPISDGVFRANLFCDEEDLHFRDQLFTSYLGHGISLVARDFHFPLVRKAFYVRPRVHIFNLRSLEAVLGDQAKSILSRASLLAGAWTVEFGD